MTASLWSFAPLLCLILVTAAQDAPQRGIPPQSPCPAVYGYGWDPAAGWYGIITILPPARFSEIQLVVRLTVPSYKPELGVGRVEVKGGTREIQAISNRAYRGERHQIQYLVIFPAFEEVPKLKELFINGYSFCKAAAAPVGSRSTIELKYVLKSGLNLPLAHGSEFSTVNTHKPGHPSRPDVITIAIIETVEEVRPLPSSNPQPSGNQQPASSESHRPCDIPNRPTATESDMNHESNALPHKKPPHIPAKVDVDDKLTGNKKDTLHVVSLLETLVNISKKRYLVELERLEIEKERLTLEKLPYVVKR